MSQEQEAPKRDWRTLCANMMNWSHDPGAICFPLFLKEVEMGWPEFQEMMHLNLAVQRTFHRILPRMYHNLLKFSESNKKQPRWMGKLITRYTTLYDTHAYNLENERDKENAKRWGYKVDDYSKADVEEKFQHHVNTNSYKWRKQA